MMRLPGMFEFYICPNTGNVIDGLPGDDKVLCNCGKSNPAAARGEAKSGNLITHFVYLLKRVPEEEGLAVFNARINVQMKI
jgi:hypothetical protein